MKKLLWLVLAIAFSANAQTSSPLPAQAKINGTLYASGYGQWNVSQGTSPTAGGINWPSPAACTVNSGGVTFRAFTVGTAVRVVDQISALTEIANVTAVSVTQGGCSINVAMTHTHSTYYLTSATGGLQEAINANLGTATPNVVEVTGDWYAQGGTSAMLTAAKGNTNIGILDVTQTPSQWYEWNGTAYTEVSVGNGLPTGTGVVKVTGGTGGLADSPDIVASLNLSPTTQLVTALIPALPYQAPLGFTPANVANNLSDLASLSTARTNLGAVATSTTVNGHPLSSNVIVSASDLTTGTLPHAQLPALVSGDIPNNAANTSGNAATATAFASAPSACTGSTFVLGISTNGTPTCGTPAGGIPTINGAAGAQTFAASGSGLTLVDSGSTHTYTLVGGGLTGGVTSESLWADGGYQSAGTTIGSPGNSSTVPAMLTAAQMQAAVTAQNSSSVLHINGPEFQFNNTANNPVQDNRLGAQPWSVSNSGAACNTKLAFATLANGSTTININSGYAFAAGDAGDTGTNLGAKWISMVGLVSGVPTRFDAYITAVSSGTQATLSAAAPFTLSDYSVTIGNDDTSQLAQAVSYGHNGDAKLVFPGNGICWSRTAALAMNGAPLQGLPGGGIVGGAGLDVTQGQTGYLKDMQFYVDARIDATHAWSFDNNGTTTAQTALYRPVGIMTPRSNNPLGPGWIRGSEPYGLYAYNGVAKTTSGSAVMCVLSSSGSIPTNGADIVFPYLTSVLHTTVLSTAGSCGTGTPITLSTTVPATVAQAEYFWGEAPGAAASGTAVQEINTAIPATGRTFPMTVNLKNPNNPEPGAESDFAPFGVVKIDGEEFQYYGTSSYPQVSGQWLKLTAGAQNGTTAAAHSIGAAIVPLNPFMPTLPWPVPTINGAGNQTPAGAEYFPAYNIGNSAIAQPVPNGTSFTGTGGFSESHIEKNTILAWPNTVMNSAEDPYKYQNTNSTAGIYMVPLPFNSWFAQNNITGVQFGIWEGGPGQNNHNYIGVPTSDTVVFDSNHISVGYAVGLTGGGTLAFTNNQLFSQNGPPNSGWYPFTPASSSGGAVCFDVTGPGPDDTTGIGRGVYTWPSGVFDAHIGANNYCEAENPGGAGNLVTTQPINVLDFSSTVWPGLSDMGGGTVYLGGTGNHISGGPFSQGDNLPLIVDGSDETIDFASNSLANTGINNQWGSSPVLVWGPNNKVTGGGSPSGDGRMSYGNSTATVDGQTNEFASTGNLAAPYVNSQGGFFAADTLNPVGNAGTAIGWTFDGTAANMTQGYSGCAVGTGVNTVQCSLFFNGRAQQSPTIGPGQAMAAGKYIWTMGVRESSGSAQNFGAYASTSCGYLDTSHTAIPISTTWSNIEVGIIDYTGTTGCALQMALNGTSSSATSIEISYISFVPLPQSFTVNNLNVLGTCSGPGCTSGVPTVFQVNGAPVASGSIINFQNGPNVTITNPSLGNVSYSALGGGGAFSSLTGGTNNGAAMLVGTGASLGITGSGTIAATSMPYSGLTGSVPTWNQNTTGTASAFSATPSACSGSTFVVGISANGTPTCATPVTGVSGLTAGYIPKAGSATTITGNSHMDDGVTTAGTITITEPVTINTSGTAACSTGAFCIVAAAGTPPAGSGVCQNSSKWYNTTGSAGSREYQCQVTTWVDQN